MANSTLILLVGSNPLPNYLAASALRPKRVILIYTPETQLQKDFLTQTLADQRHDCKIVEELTSSTTAIDVRQTIDNLMRNNDGGMSLNYTGGTKVMAAQALRAFYNNDGLEAGASYLDEGGAGKDPVLRFDNGEDRSITELGARLRLTDILSLHGIKYQPRSPRPYTPADAEVLCHAIIGNVSLAHTMYQSVYRRNDSAVNRKRMKLREASESPINFTEYGLNLSIKSLPFEGMSNSAYDNWSDFVSGEWFEFWIGERIKEATVHSNPEITIGINAFRGETRAQLQVDGAVIQGCRSYFLSCTTSTQKALCKSKLFEINIRSKHLGGDLARAALFCLGSSETVAELQNDIRALWGATNTTRVFGIEDVKAWSTHNGQAANLRSLKEWLES